VIVHFGGFIMEILKKDQDKAKERCTGISGMIN
jgi:hypothetical protein